jgi:hypothetical protein
MEFLCDFIRWKDGIKISKEKKHHRTYKNVSNYSKKKISLGRNDLYVDEMLEFTEHMLLILYVSL